MKLVKKVVHGIGWRLRRIAARTYKTGTLKVIYPAIYRMEAAKKPLNKKKIVFLEIRMMELTDNFTRLYASLEKRHEYEMVLCCVGDGLTGLGQQFKNSVHTLKEIASAGYVFINDSSSLISCITPREGTKVIQTWHACGAFKKFGFSTASKKFGGSYEQLLRFPLHKNFSVVTVSSPEVIWAYAEAFHMEDQKEKIVATGISRTDVFYDQEAILAAYEKIHRLMPESAGKKIILYAPTYRGRVAEAYSPDKMNLERMHEALHEEYVLVCKHHPFVKKRPQIPERLKDFAADMTDKMSIEELLMVSDICISDYSSLVFEYSLFERPMLFFAYDLEDYFDWRGFYYDFEQMTPGPTCKSTEEMIDYILHLDTKFDKQKVKAFKEKFMSACDGHATERILDYVMK